MSGTTFFFALAGALVHFIYVLNSKAQLATATADSADRESLRAGRIRHATQSNAQVLSIGLLVLILSDLAGTPEPALERIGLAILTGCLLTSGGIARASFSVRLAGQAFLTAAFLAAGISGAFF